MNRSRFLALVAGVVLAALGLDPAPAVALGLIANADAYGAHHDRALTVAAPGVLGNDLILLGGSTAVLNTGPAHGILNLHADGSFGYVPAAGFIGVDTFRYHAHDGLLNTNVATVTITVANATPLANDDGYVAASGVTLSVPAPGMLGNDTDGDADSLTVVLVDGGGNGSLNVAADGSFTFKSGGSFSGDRTFTYRATDRIAASAIATVTIHVGAPSSPPPSPTPAPTATPRPSSTPAPSKAPLPLPSLPLPSLPLPPIPTLPPLPSPASSPASSPGSAPTQSPSVAPSPLATAPAGGTVGPPRSGGGPGAGPDGGGGGGGPGLVIDDPAPFGSFDNFGTVTFGGFDWAVPGLALSVPGLLLILAVLAQGGAGVFSLPIVRRWLGAFGLRRRRETGAEAT